MRHSTTGTATTTLETTTISRREVLAAGAALAALAAAGPASAQPGAAAGQPVVLITGTSSGFGRLMAETFARAGMGVVATMREMEERNAPAAAELRELAEREGVAVELVEIDVTDQASVDRGVAEALERAGRIDVLVNNAGIIVPGPTELQPVGVFDANTETNLNGSLRMFRAVAPHMRERGSGYLVQFSSGLGRIVIPGMGGYCASKAAVEAVGDALSYEQASFGIDVTIVQPHRYPTRFQENGLRYLEEMVANLPADDQPRLAAFEAQVAALRENLGAGGGDADPQEVADAVLALIRTPPRERPRRISPGDNGGVARINRAHDEIQAMITGDD